MKNSRDKKGRFKKGRKESSKELEKRIKKMRGHKVTNETRKKIGDANRGKKHGPMTPKMKKKHSMILRDVHSKDPSIGKRSGKSRLGVPRKNFAPVKTAQTLAKKLGINSGSKWRRYWQTHKRPDNVPSEPCVTYKITSGEFYGTGVIATRNIQYRSFKEARKFVRKLKLTGQRGWKKYAKRNKKLLKKQQIPGWPPGPYKNEWTTWGDFLGTGNIASQNKKYRSFEKARKFVRKLGITTKAEYKQYCKSGKKPDDIPPDPSTLYKNAWNGWPDWLGYYKNQKGGWWSFEKSKKYIQKLNLKNIEEYKKLYKHGKLPDGIPSQPQVVYKKEWTSWGDFLGTGNVRPGDRQILPLSVKTKIEARKIAKKLGITNRQQWREAHQAGKIPSYFPRDIDNAYNPESKKNKRRKNK